MHGREGNMHVGSWCKNHKKRDHFEALGIDGMMILK
jgi:hypothetical protein